jgi:hypothetical protein
VAFSVFVLFSGHSMNAHELNMRFLPIDEFLDSFSYGSGRVLGHASRDYFVGP